MVDRYPTDNRAKDCPISREKKKQAEWQLSDKRRLTIRDPDENISVILRKSIHFFKVIAHKINKRSGLHVKKILAVFMLPFFYWIERHNFVANLYSLVIKIK